MKNRKVRKQLIKKVTGWRQGPTNPNGHIYSTSSYMHGQDFTGQWGDNNFANDVGRPVAKGDGPLQHFFAKGPNHPCQFFHGEKACVYIYAFRMFVSYIYFQQPASDSYIF